MTTLAQSLLLGSQRLAAPPALPHAALAAEWNELDWSGARGSALLDAAALAGTARGAGAPLGPVRAATPAAPAEPRPFAPAPAAALLPQLLTPEWRLLVPEWLERCARCGAVAPHWLLPRLLDLGADEALRPALAPVLGTRGVWLAQFQASWSWVHSTVEEPNPSLWETDLEDRRLACLRAWRQRDPATGRVLLQKTWGDEPPDFRARAIALLQTGLSADDEAFLAGILADRRKEVRLLAQSFLARLPGSALARRMRDRAGSLLGFQRGFFSKKIEVTLPAAFDPAWKADALEEKPPAGVGEKAHWLHQILALVPIGFWTEKFALAPTALLELAEKSPDWADLLLGAWYRAALLHDDAAACELFLSLVQSHPKFLPPGESPATALPKLLARCPVGRRWSLATENPSLAWSALDLLTEPPSLAQGRAFLRTIAPGLRDATTTGGSPAALLAAFRVPPALRAEAAGLFTRDQGFTKPAVAFLQALDLRAALETAFASSPSNSPPS